MEHSYPITREQLRMMPDIIKTQQKQAFINRMVEHASLEIINTAYGSKTNCEIVCSELQRVCQRRDPHVYMAVRDGSFEPYINAVVDDLKLRFPECIFSQDPAKKYLFVAW